MYKRNGFTLVELLVTISVVSIALVSITGILVAIFKIQQKQRTISDINRYGSNVVSNIEQIVRTSKSVSIDNSNKRLVYLDRNGTTRYLGIYTKSGISCADANQGYIYDSTKNDTSGATVPEADYLTDRNTNTGVDVTDLTFRLDGSDPTWVSVNLSIKKGPCSGYFDDDLSTVFTTTVRSLR